MAVPIQHAGMLLTKNLGSPNLPYTSEQHKSRLSPLLDCVPSTEYALAYNRWKSQLAALPETVLAAEFRTQDTLITGIGQASVLENSVAMNRLWGMPVIPGSSLKGLARHYSMANMLVNGDKTSQKQFDILFGTTEDAGYVTWHDAWYAPDTGKSPFLLDVVTVHHQQYYQNPTIPLTETEDPIPSYFISVKGTFLIAVSSIDQSWATAAMALLKQALGDWGAGAKTNAGYGRLVEVRKVPLTAAAPAVTTGRRFLNEIARAGREITLEQMMNWSQRWSALENEPLRFEIAESIRLRFRQYLPNDFQDAANGDTEWFNEMVLFYMDRNLDIGTMP